MLHSNACGVLSRTSSILGSLQAQATKAGLTFDLGHMGGRPGRHLPKERRTQTEQTERNKY